MKLILNKLKKFLTLLGFYKTKQTLYSEIPTIISDTERIVRVIFSPTNVKSDEKSIRSNAFRSPPGKDEVSVIRLKYCSPEFCKNQGKKSQNPDKKRTYFGLAVLTANEIREVDADVYYTPEGNHEFHADIKIGYVCERGQQLPAKFKFKVDEMVRMARLYKDPNPNSSTWEGSEIK